MTPLVEVIWPHDEYFLLAKADTNTHEMRGRGVAVKSQQCRVRYATLDITRRKMVTSKKTATIISFVIGAVVGFIAGWVVAKFVTTFLVFGFFAAILGVLAVVMRKSFRTFRRD